jgi:hypothetical protein
MEKMKVPWGAPVAARDLTSDHAAFRLSKPVFARERSYDRTVLRFTAPGERLIPEASYETSYIYAVLLDEHGQLITRRSSESNRQTLVGPVCTWAHELYDEQLARAASILYEVETRVDSRRTLFSGKLQPVDLDSEARQPWLPAGKPSNEDRLMQISFGAFYNRGDFELSIMSSTNCIHDGHRYELEVVLLDETGAVVASKWMTMSINSPGIGYNDFSLRLEKKVARAVSSLQIHARSEVRTVNRVGPIMLEDGEGKKPTQN